MVLDFRQQIEDYLEGSLVHEQPCKTTLWVPKVIAIMSVTQSEYPRVIAIMLVHSVSTYAIATMYWHAC